LPDLALNQCCPDLSFQSCQNYRKEPSAPSFSFLFFEGYFYSLVIEFLFSIFSHFLKWIIFWPSIKEWVAFIPRIFNYSVLRMLKPFSYS
jgi:hypothetical protein